MCSQWLHVNGVPLRRHPGRSRAPRLARRRDRIPGPAARTQKDRHARRRDPRPPRPGGDPRPPGLGGAARARAPRRGRRSRLHGVPARASGLGARAGARQGALRRARAGGAAARGRDLRGVARVRAAVPARQQPPAVLGLGAGHRHADGGDRGDAGGVHELRVRHLLVRRQQLRRAAGAGLVQGAARVPARGRRAAHERVLRLQPDRAGGGAERPGRVRRARGGAGGRAGRRG